MKYENVIMLGFSFLLLSLILLWGCGFFPDVAIRARIGSWQVTQLPIVILIL